ncbi:MAG: glycosyltransferase family 4 protein, partial [Thermodesulfovibrionia bacterium]
MKFKILHTEASLGWGGQEIRIVQESIELTKRGYHILIACQKGSQIAKQAAVAGLTVFTVPMRFTCDPVAIIKFLRIIKTEKVDIIHTHSSKDSWIVGIAGRLSKIPVVRSRHLSTPVGKSWHTTFVYRYLAVIIITSGTHIKEALVTRNKLNPEKIVSIPAGVDIERFDMKNINGIKILDEFGLNDAFPIVGIVAILRSWKGHRYMLEAVPKVVSFFPEARFLIVGNGPAYERIQQKIRDL